MARHQDNEKLGPPLTFLYKQHAWQEGAQKEPVSPSGETHTSKNINPFITPNNVWGIAPPQSTESRAKQLADMGQQIMTMGIEELQAIAKENGYETVEKGLAIAARGLAILVEDKREAPNVKQAARDVFEVIVRLLEKTEDVVPKTRFVFALSEITDPGNESEIRDPAKDIGKFSSIRDRKVLEFGGMRIVELLVERQPYEYRKSFTRIAEPLIYAFV